MSSVILITGAAGGIGSALARQAWQAGFRVLATDLRPEGLEALRLELQAGPERWASLPHDIRSAEDWQAALGLAQARFGRLDILVNNAGYIRPGYPGTTAVEDIDLHLDINVKGMMLGTLLAVPVMRAQGGGHLINLASLAGVAPIPGLDLYSASKFAVRAYSLATAQELRQHGIAVSVVCPDAVDTPMLTLQQAYDEASVTFSAPRFLQADEVAGIILRRVIPRRPLEVMIPAHRGLTARIANLFPGLMGLIRAQLVRRGRRRRLARSGS